METADEFEREGLAAGGAAGTGAVGASGSSVSNGNGMTLEDKVEYGRSLLNQVDKQIDEELARHRAEIERLQRLRGALPHREGPMTLGEAVQANRDRLAKEGPTKAMKGLAKLPGEFTKDQARKVFGKAIGASLAQLIRRGVVEKRPEGTYRIAG